MSNRLTPTSASTGNIRKLTAGRNYTFQVAAANRADFSEFSTPSAP